MGKKVRKGFSIAFVIAAYYSIFCLSFFLSLWARKQLTGLFGLEPFQENFINELLLISSMLCILLHLLVNLMIVSIDYSGQLSRRYIVYHAGLLFILMLTLITVYRLFMVSRLFILLTAIMYFAISYLFVLLVNATLTRLGVLRFNRERLLLVGNPSDTRLLKKNLKLENPLQKTYFFEIHDENAVVTKEMYADLVRMIIDKGVSKVYFTISLSNIRNFEKLLVVCDSLNVHVFVHSALMCDPDSNRQPSAMIDFDHNSFIDLAQKDAGSVELKIKRLMDFFGSAVLIVLFSPLLLIIAILIKLESKGPVFFVQERIGYHGRKFKIFKFRSMVQNAEELMKQWKLEHKNEHDGPVFKMKNDPRITKVGVFIRRTSIDELPQLFNVLMGQMSLVGPRPPIMKEVLQYEFWHYRRLSAPPGMTGMWQVEGRNTIKEFDEWVKLDIKYINTWSIWLDIKILFRTIFVVLSGKGAA
jgi:exopolysaccharide biosynthesis polyprenyl glycosylphosphotransferase